MRETAVTAREKKKRGEKICFSDSNRGEQMETADEKLKFTSVFLSLSTQFV